MEYSMFKEVLKEALTERFEGCTIEFKTVLKNNGIKLDGLLVRFPDSCASPTVYANDFYDRYVLGQDIDDIADHIAWLINNNKIEEGFNPDSFIGFENIKERIAFKLINFEKNEELLKTVPYKKFLDLAIVYYIAVETEIFEGASILITNDHLKIWGKTAEEIDALAKENSPKLFKPELKRMADVIKEMMKRHGEEPDEFLEEASNDSGMYVLSNELKFFGAGVVLYDNVLKDFAEEVGDNVWLIPSSIHEQLLMPASIVDSVEKLNEMICEVNATQVPLMDYLSNHAYFYNKEKGEIALP